MHAALDVHAANAHTPGLDQQADRVLQAVDVAPRVGLGAAHGDALVLQVGRGGVVPVTRQALGLEGGHHGLVKPLLRRLGEELGVVGGGGVLQQRVVALDGVELLQIAAHHGVFVGVHDEDGAVVVDDLRQGAGFGGIEQQVVAVHVHAVGSNARAHLGAIRVGAGHHHHVDAVQQRFKKALGQLAADDQQGFTAGGFVAMLLPDQYDGGAAALVQAGRVCVGSTCDQQALDGLAALRGADLQQLGARAATGHAVAQAAQPLAHLRIGREGPAVGPQTGGAVDH